MEIINIENSHCQGLTISQDVEFLKNDENSDIKNFKINAYTGQVVDRFWGKLAIDVNGIETKKNIPILREHSPKNIVGYAKKQYKKDGNFFVEGRFSESTKDGKEVKELSKEGFPWQASVGIVPLKIKRLDEKESYIVNGMEIEGPAEVWTNSKVGEVSFVTWGADDKTSVNTFSKFIENIDENKKKRSKKMEDNTVEEMKKLKKENEVLGIDLKERENRIKELKEKGKNTIDMVGELFGKEAGEKFKKIIDSGISPEQFKGVKNFFLSADGDEEGDEDKDKEKEEKTFETEQEKMKREILEALKTTGSNGEYKKEEEKENLGYLELAKKIAKENETTMGEAFSIVQKKFPEKYEEYIENNKK